MMAWLAAGCRSTVALRCGVGVALVVGSGARAGAEEIGDAARGYGFAKTYCAQCHAVEPSVPSSPNPKAPTFLSVAKTPGMTGRALAAWLDTSHPTMPNFILRTGDRDNVVAYIVSLKAAAPEQ